MGANFCVQCGAPVSEVASTETTPVVNVEMNNIVPEGADGGVCQTCGQHAPTKYNELYANIGMLVARRQLSIKANMCKKCTNKYFFRYTLTNLFLGWWGVISFFATCFYMVNNVARYTATIPLKETY